MKSKRVIPFVVGVFIMSVVIMGWAPVAMAQQAESQFQFVNEVHIVPGKTAEFEELIAARNARMGRANVTFGTRVSAGEGVPNVYRSVTLGLENLAALDTRQAQLDAMPPPAGGARGVIDHIESSIRRTRPDLAHNPANPRIPIGEAGFLREVNFYVQFGAQQEAEAITQEVRALYEKHGIRTPRFVTSQVTGSGADLRIVIPARDAADFYTENQRENTLLGEEFQALNLAARMGTLCRRIEFANRTIRRDLGYQPSN